jgi:hypothetical protein
MQRQAYVQKVWPDGTPVSEPKPLYGDKPFTPPTVTAEGSARSRRRSGCRPSR